MNEKEFQKAKKEGERLAEIVSGPRIFPRVIAIDNGTVYLQQGELGNIAVETYHQLQGRKVSYEMPYHLFDCPDGTNTIRTLEALACILDAMDKRGIKPFG